MCATASSVESPTTVRVGPGLLRGSRTDGVHRFAGVPFAAPPFGADRMRPPRPAEPWTGVRDAVAFGPEPPQLKPPSDHPAAVLVWDPFEPGEDCLNLNVWTPDPGSGGLPVMVWIPGGMFEVGTGASYDGSRFARDGVVCVTINYRVGPEGFLYLVDGDANLGLQDQVAALRWVHDNIAAFGGDPDNVTVFGESAGAMSVGTLLAMPMADGLFRRAIAQSGAAHRVIPAADATRIGGYLADRLGIPATREAFSAIPPDRLMLEAATLKGEMLARPDPDRWGIEVIASALPLQPVVDGSVIPARPIDRIDAGAAADVDIMVGSNTDDWRLFAVINGSVERVTDEALTGRVIDHGFECAAACGLDEAAVAVYRAASPGAGPGDLLAQIETDWWCRMPAIRVADAHAAARSGTYMYEFAWRSPEVGAAFGSCHALEIPFVFDTLELGEAQMMGRMLGSDPPRQLAQTVHRSWVDFASSGDPGWPRYDLHRRATMRFDTVCRIVDDPRSLERSIWAGAI